MEWHFLRPAQRFSAGEVALARAHGIGLLDRTDCHRLPSRLASLFAMPLSPDGVETERLLQSYLTRTSRTRVFADEPAVLRSTDETETDPFWAHADRWLDQVMLERGQNWLLSTHRGRAYLRAPADGRPAALQEWRLLVGQYATQGADHRRSPRPVSRLRDRIGGLVPFRLNDGAKDAGRLASRASNGRVCA